MDNRAEDIPNIVYDPADQLKTSDENNGKGKGKSGIIVENYLWSMSNLFAIQEKIDKIDKAWIQYYKELFKNKNFKNIMIVGSGFGVLPILALSEGRQIYFCESYPFLARLSEGNIYKHHLKNKVEIESIHCLFKEISDIQYPGDIKNKCDLLVFDNFDHTILETGIVQIIRHLKREILAENAVIAPEKIKLNIAAIEYGTAGLDEYQWAIGLRPFDPVNQKYRALSGRIEIGDLDFKENFDDANKEYRIDFIDDGYFNYVLIWYELYGQKHYSIQYIEPVEAAKGDKCEITFIKNEYKIRFQIKARSFSMKNKLLPAWYSDMLNDSERNDKYNKAIAEVFRNPDIKSVLDVGSGFGSLSMMIAGIRPDIKIYSCEIMKKIAETAKNLVLRNGLDRQIETINEDILKLELEEPVDAVVFETFDCGLIGEGALHFADHCREKLLKKGGIFLPKKAVLYAIAVEKRTGNIDDIDLSLVNPYRWKPDYSQIDLDHEDYKKLSEPFEVFSFRFADFKFEPGLKEMDIRITDEGILGAIVFWFELLLTDDVRLTSSPFSGSENHWKQAIQYIQEMEVGKGNIIPLIVKNTTTRFEFSVNTGKLDSAIMVLKTPRFDHNWLKKFQETEYGFQGYLNRSNEKREEYEDIVMAFLKIAETPWKYKVLPKYACKMAESFFF